MPELNERETITDKNGFITIDDFDSVYGCSLVYCLGDYLPYNVIKKYEEEEGFSLLVELTVEYDEDIVMMVMIENKEVFNKSITKKEFNIISCVMEVLRNDINELIEDNDDEDECHNEKLRDEAEKFDVDGVEYDDEDTFEKGINVIEYDDEDTFEKDLKNLSGMIEEVENEMNVIEEEENLKRYDSNNLYCKICKICKICKLCK